MESYEELRKAVVEDNGLHQAQMWQLKGIKGAGRLGVHVRDAISRELASHGMGHIPSQLPSYQEEPVRLYLLGSPIADIVQAVLQPSDRGDEALRALGNEESQEIIRQIRQLVCG
ncbi:hypothetical protein ACIOJE_13805 [Kitasatospora sp. NPDC087861]|uniref:hypothetical protein n=1 Tax=Kitasatospora sp. NPDC087861 TaxID=3364070 RepID=UPI00380BA362